MSEEAELLAIASRRVGTVLHGKYHIDSVLGVGGMATVYAATHRNRKRFAVKVLHPEFSVRAEVRARFVREGYVANSVPHTGVVAVLDDDVDETGAAFLVMELLDGATVEALYARGGPMSVREALSITDQLLGVLEVAHRRSVVHRDIKPANLFVARDGQLKILDFGIARLRDGDAGLKSTRGAVVLGTPAFMAPEQALAMPENVDERSDIWAAGATLFTMLSASFVHPGVNGRQLMIRAATEPARSIQSVMPEVPGCVAAIVARALAFERSERWPSAAAMRQAVVDTFVELFGCGPVRADVVAVVERTSATPVERTSAALVERTSAALVERTPAALVERAPSEHDPTEPAPAAARPENTHPSKLFSPRARDRALETTMATPVAVLAQAPVPRKKRRVTAIFLPAAALVMGGAVALRALPTTSFSPLRSVSNEAARADSAPPPELEVKPEATARVLPARPLSASPSAPAKPPSPPVRVRKVSRPPPASSAVPPAAATPVAASVPENPLKLRLQ